MFLGKLSFGILSLASSLSMAASYKLDTAHTEVGFSVKHLMVSNVKGRFNKFEGAFEFDEKKNELKAVDVKIDVASVDTNNKDRDQHLAGDDFFSVKKFPEMHFKSDKVEMKDGKPSKISGNLTMHGITKPVTMDLDYRGTVTDPYGNEKVGFSATTKINRKDFGLNWNKTLDKGGVAVGEEVQITIDGEANKAKK